MREIVRVMHNCKLVIFNTAKSLFPGPKTAMADNTPPGYSVPTPWCVWSGKQIISESSVRAATLSPLKSSVAASSTTATSSNGELASPVMFHIDVQYANVLKCMHTLLFFLDYLNMEIQNKMKTFKVDGSTESHDAMWERMYDPPSSDASATVDAKAKKKPFTVLSLAAQTQLTECVRVMRTVLDEKYFVVKSKV
jgi:hypothetical protein